MVWTLATIRNKIREVTGTFTSPALSNEEITNYINTYYTTTFACDVRLEQMETVYGFVTELYHTHYPVPSEYINFFAPATADRFTLEWFISPYLFNKACQTSYLFSVPWVGNGITRSFSLSRPSLIISPGTLVVSNSDEIFEDSNTVWSAEHQVIYGSRGGLLTFRYRPFELSVEFNRIPEVGEPLHVNFVSLQLGRPRALLFQEENFILFPAPDQAYRIEMSAIKKMKPLLEPAEAPLKQDWGRTLVYGAALAILADKGALEAYASLEGLYRQELNRIRRQTLIQQGQERSIPTF